MKKIIKTIFSTMFALALIFAFTGCESKRLKEISKGWEALRSLDKETATIENIIDIFSEYNLCGGDIWDESERPAVLKSDELRIWSERANLEDVKYFFKKNDNTTDKTKYAKFTAALIERFGIGNGYRCAAYCWDQSNFGSVSATPVKSGNFYVSAGAEFIRSTVDLTEDKEAMAKEALFDYLKDPESLIVRSVYLSAPSYKSLDEFYEETKDFSDYYHCGVDYGTILNIQFSSKNSYGGYDSPKTAAFKVVLETIKSTLDDNRHVYIPTRVYKYKKIYIN